MASISAEPPPSPQPVPRSPFLAGVSTWITGAVRHGLARSEDLQRLRRQWRIAGMAVTFSGLAASAAGAVALGISVTPEGASSGSIISGFVLLSLGVTTALFIGIPMWVEPHRKV